MPRTPEEQSVIDSLLDGTIVEFKDNITTVPEYVFSMCQDLVEVDLPNVVTVGIYAFNRCYALAKVNLPNATNISTSAFYSCKALTEACFPKLIIVEGNLLAGCGRLDTLDLPVVTTIKGNACQQCNALKTVILRSESMVTLAATSAFNACYHFDGTTHATINPTGARNGYFYVPRALVDSYKTATNWSTYATQFRALEDYTVDGTTTGELDETKI